MATARLPTLIRVNRKRPAEAGSEIRCRALFRLAVEGAQRNHRHIGICGEAPANDPQIARFLTGIGIDAISVNPTSLLRTIAIVAEAETGRPEAFAKSGRYPQVRRPRA